MLEIIAYDLHPTDDDQRLELKNIVRNYSNLRNEMADLVRAKIPADEELKIDRVGAIVDAAFHKRAGVPTRYINLGKTSVLWHMKRHRDIFFDPSYSVDLDAAVATPVTLGSLTEKQRNYMTLKAFNSKPRERLLVPCSWKVMSHMTPSSKVGGAVLTHDNGYNWKVFVTVEGDDLEESLGDLG